MNKLSGYIEVELGGQIRPIKFGMGAWEIFTQSTGVQMHEIGEMSPIKFSASIIFAGLRHAALSQNLDASFTIHNVYDWLDEVNDEQYKLILQTLAESKVLGKTFREYVQANETEDTNSKKKKPLKT